MAGFYGRVINNSQTSMSFDREYSNRVNMYNSASTDGVMVGRLVLVSYYKPDEVETSSNPNYYVDNTDEQEIYNKNFLKDKNNGYPNLGNGYDATVWRKVVDSQGNYTYAMLAHLNTVVPIFDLIPEAPSNEPVAPYIGPEDQTNVYYPLHMSTNWGFRIADAPVRTIDNVNVTLSDYWVDNQIEYVITDEGEVIEVPQSDAAYQGAIYFNKAGFLPNKTHRVNDSVLDNKIALEQVASGNTYGIDDIEKADTQELSIILPALGNAVSDMYDLMYGSSLDTPTGKRYMNTAWYDANARDDENRQVSRGLTYYKNNMGANYSAFAPNEAYSMAGTINSVHDMLGMIITASERPEDANDAYANQIYYVDYELTNDDEPRENKTYYTYDANLKIYTELMTLDPWDKNSTYEFRDKYYCTVETPQYHEPIEFEAADFNLSPADFKVKFKDAEIPYPSQEYHKPQLKIYPGGKYIKTDDSPTFELAEAPETEYGGAVAGATYYDLPATITYAGRQVMTKDGKYYSLDNGTSGKDARPDDEGSWVLVSQDDVILYHILPNTEFYHVGEIYWALNDAQTEYVMVNGINTSNFETYVASGLYRNAEIAVKTIANNNMGSTGFKIHYIDNDGRDRLQDLQGLAGGNSAYISHLSSEVDFINFVQTSMEQLENVDTVDLDYLYIDNSLEPDGQGGYSTNYHPYPISRFLFAELDSNSGYYKDIYIKNGDTYERATVRVNDSVSDTTLYRLSFSQETLFTGGWCIQVPAEQLATLQEMRANQLLTSVNTSDYDISVIYWNNIWYPDNIYWTIEGGEEAFTEVGYGISTTNTAEDDAKEESGKDIYYAPNALYYKDAADEYVLANDSYIYDGVTTLYRLNELIIIDRGDLTQLRTYSRWDNNLIRETADIAKFFKPIAEGGHGVQIAHKYIGREWKEMPGFARHINTIHGWIARLNQLLNTSDVKSRDLNTYQGCVNTVKDLLARFGDFTPGGYLQVNQYGQVETVSAVTPDMSGALATVSASFTQTTTDGLHLALTQSNGVITAFNGSIGAITYTPTVDDGNGGYEPSATTSTMTLAAALAKISELELRIQALENA